MPPDSFEKYQTSYQKKLKKLLLFQFILNNLIVLMQYEEVKAALVIRL